MPGKLSDCEFNPTLVEEGEWWEDYRGLGFDIKVAHWMNPNHRAKLFELYALARDRVNDDSEIDEDQVNAEAQGHAIWTDFRGMLDDDGNEIESTPERRTEILQHPGHTRLRMDIVERAQQDDRYLARAVGNLEAASDGN